MCDSLEWCHINLGISAHPNLFLCRWQKFHVLYFVRLFWQSYACLASELGHAAQVRQEHQAVRSNAGTGMFKVCNMYARVCVNVFVC